MVTLTLAMIIAHMQALTRTVTTTIQSSLPTSGFARALASSALACPAMEQVAHYPIWLPNVAYGKLRSVDELEALQTIGRLIKEERLAQGLSQVQLAKQAGTAIKTVRTLESGTRRAQEINQRKLEHALGWRAGSVSEVLKGKSTFAPDMITPDDMRNGDETRPGPPRVAVPSAPIARASHLSDEELLAEITYRMMHRNRG